MFYGICYSEESDILWDIYQVLRHECYLNFYIKIYRTDAMKTAREQLIKIKTIIENDE